MPLCFIAGEARRPSRYRRMAGFTLVELLVAIGIIVLLISILIPVVSGARKKAAANRAQRDIEALRTGLEEYKNNFNEYPAIGFGGSKTGQQALYCALVGRNQSGTATNVPISNSKSGRPAPSLINTENFRAKFIDVNNGWLICDENDWPYLYFRATVPMPDIRSATQGGFAKSTAIPPGTPSPLYNLRDCVPSPNNTKVTFNTTHFQRLLGDDNGNGLIDANEQPSTTGPYLLWTAGPDQIYGLDPNGNKSDDITNFPLPMKYQK